MSDLIRREDVRTALKENVIEMGGDDWCEVGVHCGDIDAIVDSVPTADRPKGKWVDGNGNIVPLDKNGCLTGPAWCSICGDWLTASDEYATRGWFCPNCGADMRGIDDE